MRVSESCRAGGFYWNMWLVPDVYVTGLSYVLCGQADTELTVLGTILLAERAV